MDKELDTSAAKAKKGTDKHRFLAFQKNIQLKVCLTSSHHVLLDHIKYWSKLTQLLFILSWHILSGLPLVSIYILCALLMSWSSIGFL